MSDYFAPAVHPKTGKVEQAHFMDDYFGRWRYGVRFPDETIWPVGEVKLPYAEEPNSGVDGVARERQTAGDQPGWPLEGT